MKSLIASSAVLVLAAGANAAILVQDLGTAAPPATLGAYTMVPFGNDARPTVNPETSIGVADGAPFGVLNFNETVNHHKIGAVWSTWSHGYTGDVYHVNINDGAAAPLYSVTLGIPAGAGAFYFYAEPEPFQQFTISAVSGNTFLSVQVQGEAGANGWGFYTDDFSALTTITVSSQIDFAIGEFGIARVPAPGAGALALAGLGMIARRRR